MAGMSPSAASLRAPVSPATLKDPAAVADAYARWINRTGLAANSKLSYASRVRGFTTWLATSLHDPEEAFTDTDGRDYAVRDYRRRLLAVDKRAPRTVSQTLVALGSFYGDWLGLGRPRVDRVSLPVDEAPKALDEDQTRAVLRAAQRRGVRDLALMSVFLLTGVRGSELAALDVDDVWITERRGEVAVRAGKGDQPRKVPLNAQARDALRPWLALRPGWLRDPSENALWVAKVGGHRIGVRGIRKTVTAVGAAAGVDVAPHMLRHTFATQHAQVHGTDLATVAAFLGHKDLKTTQVYLRATPEHREKAAERFSIDF